MLLGHIRVKEFLNKTNGKVRGGLLTDAKNRAYYADYVWVEDKDDPQYIWVSREDKTGERVKVKAVIDLDESLVAFFGLYSGDGAKGSEDPNKLGRIKGFIHTLGEG